VTCGAARDAVLAPIALIAGPIELRLPYRRPADLTGIVAFLGARAVPGVEEVDGATYRRSLVLPHGTGVAELTPATGHLRATLRLSDFRDLTAAVARCRRLFDLDADSVAVDEVLAADPALAPLVRAVPGIRVPGAVDGDELAVRAVLGQQVSGGSRPAGSGAPRSGVRQAS
jgi:AraC family transcriptional regulator of adaptative response / DNA-3-methyladenine glycosylase II